MVIKLPIIIDEFGDVLVFESVEKAESFLEPIDVINDDVIAYDGEGRLLTFSIETGIWFDRVVLHSAEKEPNHAPELRHALVRFLSQLGVSDKWLSRASLSDLVNRAVKEYNKSLGK
jgi:hypothetical protein